MNTLLSILLFTSLGAAEPQASPAVPTTTSNLNNILYVDGTRFNGAPDLGKTLNTMITFLPKVRGYPAGQIVIPPGSYAQSTTVVINSPYVSFHGAGSGSTIVNCSVPTGDCFRGTQVVSVFISSVEGNRPVLNGEFSHHQGGISRADRKRSPTSDFLLRLLLLARQHADSAIFASLSDLHTAHNLCGNIRNN